MSEQIVVSEAIIESNDEFCEHLREAALRGCTVRALACTKCAEVLSVEFIKGKLSQTKFVACMCGTINRSVYRP